MAASAEAKGPHHQQADYREALDARGKQIDCLNRAAVAKDVSASDLKRANLQLATALYRRGVMRPKAQDRTEAVADLKAAVEQYKALYEQVPKETKADKGLLRAHAETVGELANVDDSYTPLLAELKKKLAGDP